MSESQGGFTLPQLPAEGHHNEINTDDLNESPVTQNGKKLISLNYLSSSKLFSLFQAIL